MNEILLHDLLANQVLLERTVWARRAQKALQGLGILPVDPQEKVMTSDELKGHIEFLRFVGLSTLGLREMLEALKLRQERLYAAIMRDEDIMTYLRSQDGKLEVEDMFEAMPHLLHLLLNARGVLRSYVENPLIHAELAYRNNMFVLLNDEGITVAHLEHRIVESEVDGIPDLALVIWMPDLLVPYYFTLKNLDSYGTKHLVVNGGIPLEFKEEDGVWHITRIMFNFETDLGEPVRIEIECDFVLEETFSEVIDSAFLFIVAAKELWKTWPKPTSVADLNLWLRFLKEVEKLPGQVAFAKLTPAGYNWQSALAVALVDRD